MKECFTQDWHIDADGQMEQTGEVDVLSKHTLTQDKTFLFFLQPTGQRFFAKKTS